MTTPAHNIYDDTQWTREELQAVAWEVIRRAGAERQHYRPSAGVGNAEGGGFAAGIDQIEMPVSVAVASRRLSGEKAGTV